MSYLETHESEFLIDRAGEEFEVTVELEVSIEGPTGSKFNPNSYTIDVGVISVMRDGKPFALTTAEERSLKAESYEVHESLLLGEIETAAGGMS